MSALDLLGYFIAIQWSIASIFVILGLIGYLGYHPQKAHYKATNVEFVLTTKANESVSQVLFENISDLQNRFPEYPLNIVIDEGSPLQFQLEETRDYSPIRNINLIIVPKSYIALAVAKGRSTQYFVTMHVKPDSTFYIFLDDDSRLMDDEILYEIPYYLAKGYPVCVGLITIRPGNSSVAHIIDRVRQLDDVTISRFATGLLHRPLNGVHGELFGCTGIVLKHVGFNRRTVTEDFSFANQLDKLHYHIWQSNSQVSIRSPNTVKDLIRQRNRWWRGVSSDVQSASPACKLFIGTRAISWAIAVTSTWLFFPLWILIQLPLPWILFNLISALYYWSAYGYGALKAHKYWVLPLIPFLNIPEALAPWWHVEDKWNFNVIDKNNWNPP